jgi:predicted GNAT family N-acyltransferase
MIRIKRIDLEDPLYEKERQLRNEILLRPIGIPDFGWEHHDAFSWHFVALDDLELVGCVVLVPLDDKGEKSQLIQMAVDETRQGEGIGRLLVEHLIGFAKKTGLHEIQIHSRSDVSTFYSHLGFERYGKEFKEVGVAHVHMRMKLKP